MEDASRERKEVAGCDRCRGRRTERYPGENSRRRNVWRRDAEIAARIFAETNFRAGGASADVEWRKINVRRRIACSLRRRGAYLSRFAFRGNHCPAREENSWHRSFMGALRELAEAVCDSERKTRYGV